MESGALPGSILDLRLMKLILGDFFLFLAIARQSNPVGPYPNHTG